MLARSVRDLDAYKIAFGLQQEIYQLTKTFPADEKYSLIDQIRRSSRSIGANLSESWAKRRYPAHFVSKLSDSDGETEETIHWLLSAHACGYIDDQTKKNLITECRHIGAILNKMMANADSWCKHYLKKS